MYPCGYALDAAVDAGPEEAVQSVLMASGGRLTLIQVERPSVLLLLLVVVLLVLLLLVLLLVMMLLLLRAPVARTCAGVSAGRRLRSSPRLHR